MAINYQCHDRFHRRCSPCSTKERKGVGGRDEEEERIKGSVAEDLGDPGLEQGRRAGREMRGELGDSESAI
jgi:hypothetical protein